MLLRNLFTRSIIDNTESTIDRIAASRRCNCFLTVIVACSFSVFLLLLHTVVYISFGNSRGLLVLANRRKRVLIALVDEYVESAAPVGSTRIAGSTLKMSRQRRFETSSCTLRTTVMPYPRTPLQGVSQPTPGIGCSSTPCFYAPASIMSVKCFSGEALGLMGRLCTDGGVLYALRCTLESW